MKRTKIGRNDPCLCGSGKKYKHCHGGFSQKASFRPDSETLDAELASKMQDIEALQRQREQQQGLGRPIISTLFKGHRIVAVGSRLYCSKAWKTFHDFVLHYIKFALGQDWGNEELKKEYEDRHPILQWYDLVCKYQQANIKEPGTVDTGLMTGAMAAYLGLAYNLYLLAHNVTLQSRLIERLKEPQQFHGAYYETYVAAAFVKAGFNLEFEQETNVSTSHCEFTATFRQTGKSFSVEAKARLPNKSSSKIGNQLYKALRKRAKHERVIFVDVNVPNDANDVESVAWLEEALTNVREKEASMTIDGEIAPEAYVFVTNHPYQYNLETTSFRRAVLAEGFKIPDFKMDTRFRSIRDALKARERHHEMFRLMESIRSHYEVPSTFDGEIPEFAFGDYKPRLRFRQKYLVPSEEGKEVVGELVDAVVLEEERLIYGVYKLEDGRTIIASCPVTDDELSAYRRYPDTFFGAYRRQGRRTEDPIELFDSCYETYCHTPKSKLLEFLRDHPDFESMKDESREELAITYCEGLVYSIMNSNPSMQRTR